MLRPIRAWAPRPHKICCHVQLQVIWHASMAESPVALLAMQDYISEGQAYMPGNEHQQAETQKRYCGTYTENNIDKIACTASISYCLTASQSENCAECTGKARTSHSLWQGHAPSQVPSCMQSGVQVPMANFWFRCPWQISAWLVFAQVPRAHAPVVVFIIITDVWGCEAPKTDLLLLTDDALSISAITV